MKDSSPNFKKFTLMDESSSTASDRTEFEGEMMNEDSKNGMYERTAEEILHDHFERVCTPANNRAPLETQLTLVIQAALLAMNEYALTRRSSTEEQNHDYKRIAENQLLKIKELQNQLALEQENLDLCETVFRQILKEDSLSMIANIIGNYFFDKNGSNSQ